MLKNTLISTKLVSKHVLKWVQFAIWKTSLYNLCWSTEMEVHWVSKETYHFFRATLTKIHCIKINHIWTQISYSFSLWNTSEKFKGLLLPKRRKMQWNCQRSLFKNLRNCSLRTSAKGCLFRIFNSNSFNFKGGLCNRCIGYCTYRAPCLRGKQFLWFLKNYLLQFYLTLLLQFYLTLLFFYSSKRLFIYMCLIKSTIANLCLIMIHFNTLDFSECRSEKWCFFWRSVYIHSSKGL